jgi:hypothetical protein
MSRWPYAGRLHVSPELGLELPGTQAAALEWS